MINVDIPFNFEPRDYQREFISEIEKAIDGESDKRFFYQVWHRRSGKDKCNIAYTIPRKLVKEPCQVKYVYPTTVMGRANMWEALGKDGFKFTDHIAKEMRVGDPNESRMLIKTLNYQGKDPASLFQVVGANNPDSLRGGGPKLFVISEWAEHDPYTLDVIEPIVRENDGIVVFNTTPKGENHARATLETAKNNPRWWYQTLTVDDTGIFTKEEMQQIEDDVVKRFVSQGRSEEEALAYIQQEYYCSFDSPVIGSYYGAAIQKAEREERIGNVPYEKRLPVDTWWDLGMDDSMTIWFVQRIGMEIRLIDYYENSGEGLEHYVNIMQEKKYIYGQHIFPHDIEVRELNTGKSRKETVMSLGLRPAVVAPKLGIDEGINAVRSMLNQCWFDEKKCYRGIQAMKNYKKDWDDKNMVYRKGPLHNWASHGADSFRTGAVGYKKRGGTTQQTGGVKPYYPGMPG